MGLSYPCNNPSTAQDTALLPCQFMPYYNTFVLDIVSICMP